MTTPKQPENKPRKWWLASLLSIIKPGLGQIYNGQGRKAVIFFLLPLLQIPLIYVLLEKGSITLLLAGLAIFVVGIYLIALIDAIVISRKHRFNYQLKRYNSLPVYLILLVALIAGNGLLSFGIKSNLMEAFSIPSGNNIPTIMVGDLILTDKRAKARTPDNGDMIIFDWPVDPEKKFIQRVVAGPGDLVEIRDKVLLVNNEPMSEDYAVHNDPEMHSTLELPRDNYGPERVPDNAYFVLGDNRDYSYDSRFWGYVGSSEVQGTAIGIYWSYDKDNSTGRWERVGRKL
ncbi:MAG: signal peptidase I [Desulfuromonas sp.]|nr:MAG: signal peptidase I [Desulfuromonas sp.]